MSEGARETRSHRGSGEDCHSDRVSLGRIEWVGLLV